MPAGDQVTVNWHVELRALLHGPGTAYVVDRSRGAIKGLGVPLPKTADVELDQAAGAYGGGDLAGVRVVTCAFLIKAASAAAAMNALSSMNTAWASSATAIPLYMRLAGWGKFFVDGHPRGIDEDITLAELGIIPVLARFDALTPTIRVVTVPGAPGTPTATAGVGSATVNWTAPASNGNAAITNYRVTPYIGGTAQAATTVGNVLTATITGLTAGQSYTFKVAAINSEGTGADSASSNAVTPT